MQKQVHQISPLKVLGYIAPQLSRLLGLSERAEISWRHGLLQTAPWRFKGFLGNEKKFCLLMGLCFPTAFALAMATSLEWSLLRSGLVAGIGVAAADTVHKRCWRDLKMVHFCIHRGNSISEQQCLNITNQRKHCSPFSCLPAGIHLMLKYVLIAPGFIAGYKHEDISGSKAA